jgi:hypothetical protein
MNEVIDKQIEKIRFTFAKPSADQNNQMDDDILNANLGCAAKSGRRHRC